MSRSSYKYSFDRIGQLFNMTSNMFESGSGSQKAVGEDIIQVGNVFVANGNPDFSLTRSMADPMWPTPIMVLRQH